MEIIRKNITNNCTRQNHSSTHNIPKFECNIILDTEQTTCLFNSIPKLQESINNVKQIVTFVSTDGFDPNGRYRYH
jgi:hypothetical protein